MPSFLTFHPATRAVSALALVASSALAPWSAHAQSAVPAMKSEGAGGFVCGGIGSDESGAMRGAMKQHPLSLLFARPNGDYLADVDVVVKDAKGATAMTFRAGGPVCLVDLPAGSYGVQATSAGVTKSENTTVGGSPRTLDFRF